MLYYELSVGYKCNTSHRSGLDVQWKISSSLPSKTSLHEWSSRIVAGNDGIQQGRHPEWSLIKTLVLFKKVTCFLLLCASRSDTIGLLIWRFLMQFDQFNPPYSQTLDINEDSVIHALWSPPLPRDLPIIWWLETPNCLWVQADKLSSVLFCHWSWGLGWIVVVRAHPNSHQMGGGFKP